MTVYIYGLIDPTNHQVSYVGKTNDLYGRWRQHLADATNSPKAQWLQKLQAMELKPTLVVLECLKDEAEHVDAERFWIAHGLRLGWPLKNTAYPDAKIVDWESEVEETQRAGEFLQQFNADPRALDVLRRVKAGEGIRDAIIAVYGSSGGTEYQKATRTVTALIAQLLPEEVEHG